MTEPVNPRDEILARLRAAQAPEPPPAAEPGPRSPARAARRRSAKKSAEASQTGGEAPEGSQEGAAASEDGATEPPEREWDLDCARLPLTDLGNAERFVLRHGDSFLYVPEWDDAQGKGLKAWLAWDGRRWSRAAARMLLARAVHDTVRAIEAEAYAFAGSSEDGEVDVVKGVAVYQSDRIRAWAKASQAAGKVNCIAALAQPYLQAPLASFDADPMALAVANGTLRFRLDPDGGDSVTFTDSHERGDRITRLADVAYDPDATCPQYDRFLAKVQPDPAVQRHLACWGGVGLTGDTSLQKMAFWYGKGRNGKSTLLNAWAHIAGDYAATIPIESFLDQGRLKKGSEASPDLAKLVGIRMLTTSEGEAGAKIAESLIKTATGEETLTVRELHSGFFDLRVEFTLTMFGNHKPRITGTDDGIWARVVFVPWLVRIPDAEIDRGLTARLKAEAPGILNRLLDGIRDYLDNGLVLPDQVAEATAAFRSESDPLGRFLEDCTAYAEGARIQSTELHRLFSAWCLANGETAWKIAYFGRQLGERGYRSHRSSVVYWRDIAATRSGHDLVENWEGDPKNWRPKVAEPGPEPARGGAPPGDAGGFGFPD